MLSSREYQVASLVSKGFSNPQASQYLGISEATVSSAVARIYKKLKMDHLYSKRIQLAVMFSKGDLWSKQKRMGE
jgi:DNA-binding NarL/FixJ family response regulator